MLCHVILCYVMLCYVTLCCVMFCSAMSFGVNLIIRYGNKAKQRSIEAIKNKAGKVVSKEAKK